MAVPRDILLMDCAKGTELGRMGCDLSPPIWTARALVEQPELVARVHREAIAAGAEAIVTATFRTHRRNLARAGLGDRAEALTREAVRIARAEADAADHPVAVLGCVAPLEDCYRPDLVPGSETCEREHRAHMETLLDAGVDMLAIETMCSEREAVVAGRVAQALAPGRWMLSFCMKSIGPPGILLHGHPVVDVLEALDGAWAVGVNCVSAPATAAQVRLLRRLVRAPVRISAHANVGGMDGTGLWQQTDANEPERYADYAMDWIAAGATLVGGCCGTSPAMIRAIVQRLEASGFSRRA